jgi:very-short-patch-repair endonuclease
MANFPKTHNWQISTKQRSRARELRRNSTDADRLIWSALRHRMNGAGFRRQVPIGPYGVDFVCHAARLVIELDGGHHFESEQEQRDARRDTFLASSGFRILRFNNYDVITNRDGVLETIALQLNSPLPNPPPQAGGGGDAPCRGQRSALPQAQSATPTPEVRYAPPTTKESCTALNQGSRLVVVACRASERDLKCVLLLGQGARTSGGTSAAANPPEVRQRPVIPGPSAAREPGIQCTPDPLRAQAAKDTAWLMRNLP